MGIGIGWPNNTSGGSSNLRSGWFEIVGICVGGELPVNAFTYFVTDVNWQTGDYVYSPDLVTRVVLGNYVDIQPEFANFYSVGGEAYADCS